MSEALVTPAVAAILDRSRYACALGVVAAALLALPAPASAEV